MPTKPVARRPESLAAERSQEEAFLHSVNLADVEIKEQRWLWYPYIPAGKLTSLEGDPGTGKSWITCAITKAITTGDALPGMSQGLPPQKVLIASAEDGISDTLTPRLASLGANLKLVSAVDEHFTLDQKGIGLLRNTMRRFAATIVFIDPIVAYLGAKVDMHRANEVREVTDALSRSAEESNCAVVFVRHLRKGQGGKDLYRGIGSIDFTASCRSVLATEEWPDGSRALRQIKSNYGPKGDVIYYEFSDEPPEVWRGSDNAFHSAPKTKGGTFRWGKMIPEATPKPRPKPGLKPKSAARAAEFLKRELANGPMFSKDLYKLAAAEGLTPDQLKYSKGNLSIVVEKVSDKWRWTMLDIEADMEALVEVAKSRITSGQTALETDTENETTSAEE